MRTFTKLVGAAATLLLLAGCTAEAPAEEPATEDAAVAETPSETPTPTYDGMAYCENLKDGLQDYVDFIAATAAGDFDLIDFRVMQKWGDKLSYDVPPDGEDELEDLMSPLEPIKEAVDSGGGSLTLNTDDFKTGAQTTLEYCVDVVGYSG